MDNKNKIILFALAFFSLFLLILIFLSSFFLNKKSSSSSINQTQIQISPKEENQQQPERATNWEIIPDFTGVSNPPMTEEEKNKNDEAFRLRENLPFDNESFSIDFDYGEYIFVVNIKEPKKENQEKFLQWLKDNYPHLDINQFLLK